MTTAIAGPNTGYHDHWYNQPGFSNNRGYGCPPNCGQPVFRGYHPTNGYYGPPVFGGYPPNGYYGHEDYDRDPRYERGAQKHNKEDMVNPKIMMAPFVVGLGAVIGYIREIVSKGSNANLLRGSGLGAVIALTLYALVTGGLCSCAKLEPQVEKETAQIPGKTNEVKETETVK